MNLIKKILSKILNIFKKAEIEETEDKSEVKVIQPYDLEKDQENQRQKQEEENNLPHPINE